MKDYLTNLNNLFSDDDKVVINAVNEKRTWILHKFYVVCSLKDNADVEDILERRLRFKKLYLNPALFVNNPLAYEGIFNKFNDLFRVLYLSAKPKDELEDDEFILELNFNKLSQSEYQALVANFYPCLVEKDIIYDDSESTIALLKCAMDKNMGDDVIILDKNVLIDSCFKCNVFNSIIIYKNFNRGYLPSIKLLCDSLNIRLEENND